MIYELSNLHIHEHVYFLSPVFYLCFIDELINLLVSSKYGFKINRRNICSPAVAYDMLLMALSKLGLDELLRICFLYSC